MGRVLQTTRRVVGPVVAAWVVPSLVIAAPAQRAAVRVEIDVSAVEAIDAFDAGGIEKSVRAKTEKLLGDEGWFMDDAAEDAIVVRVEYVDREDLEYGIHIHVFDDGKELQPGEEWIVCKYCSHGLVGDRYAERLPKVLGRLAGANQRKAEEAAARAGAEAKPEPEPRQDLPAASEPTGDAAGDEPRRPFVLRNAGLAMVIPGGVALGVGLGLVLAGTREVDDDSEVDLTERNYRPPGIAVMAVGAAASAVGIGLLVTHAVRRRGAGDERISWSPMVGGTQAGVVLRGRF